MSYRGKAEKVIYIYLYRMIDERDDFIEFILVE